MFDFAENHNRTVGDACPYSKRTSIYFLSHQKALRDAMRQSLAITKKVLRGLGHSRKCPNDFFASFFFA